MRSPFRLPVLGLLACMAGSSACGRGSEPDIDTVSPQAICVEQGAATVTVSGHGLAPMVRHGLTDRPEAVGPGVTLVRSREFSDAPAPPTASSVALSSASVRWTDRSSLGFEIAPGTVGPGVYDLEIRNPNGEVTRLADALAIVPPPAAGALEPEVIPGEQQNAVTVRGDFFVAAADALPTLLVHGAGAEPLSLPADAVGDCTALPGPGALQRCRAVTLTLPPGALPPGAFAVEVVNPAPAGCTTRGFAAGTEARLPLTVVPGPRIATVGPGVSCVAETDGVLTVTGENFLVHGDGSPTLLLGALPLAATASGCAEAELEPGFAPRALPLSICTELTATLPRESMPPGVVDAVVQNPPTSPGASEPVPFLVAGPPVVSGLAADVLCTEDGDTAVVLLGEGFLAVAGETPVVRLGTLEVPAEAGGCTPVPGLAQPVEVCTELSAELPEDSLAGPYPVVVTNPSFAPCSSIEPFTVVNFAPPTIAGVDPPRFCGAADAELTLTGTDFLVLGGVVPTVEIGGAEVAAVPKGCLPVVGSTTGARHCTELEISVPAGTIEFAAQEIEVENPAPADCGAAAPVPVEVALPPVISSARVVVSVGGAAVVEISGSGFLPGAAVSVDGIATSGGTVVSPTSAIAVVAPGGSATDGATVTIDNGDGCVASAEISGGALPFLRRATAGGSRGPLLSTRAALGAVTTPLTITGADQAASVELRGSAGSRPLPFAADPLRPGYLLAALPRGTAAGSYDVVVTDRDGRRDHAGRLEVVDAADAAEEAATEVAEPGEGARREVASSTPDAGAVLAEPGDGAPGEVVSSAAEAGPVVAEPGEEALLEVADDGVGLPAAYLVRSGAGGAAVAVPLAAVARRANGTLAAGTAGAALEPGDYDLLLVGPIDGGTAAEARVALRALHVSDPAPPEHAAAATALPALRPEIVAVSLVAAEAGGLDAGTWHYRVAAKLASSGETVASAPAGIDVPGDAGGPVAIELEWAPVEDAVSYRVYRTAAPGEPAGAERLLAETPADATSFVDGGDPAETAP